MVDKEWTGSVGLLVHDLACHTLVLIIIKFVNYSDRKCTYL